MKNKFLIICLLTYLSNFSQSGQLDFEFIEVEHDNRQLEIFDFVTDGEASDRIKLKYFSHKAFPRYKKWKEQKEILLVTAGGFVDSPTHMGKPIGLTAEDGQIVNKFPDDVMDGVLVIPPAEAATSLDLINLDFSPDCNLTLESEELGDFNPRDCWKHIYPFFEIIKNKEFSIMQSQLLYSNLSSYEANFGELITGKENRKRRYLVLAVKNNMQHALIVQPKDYCYLKVGAKIVYDYLDANGYTVASILNLDTGSNNILHVSNGNELVNKNPYNETVAAYSFHARIKNSLNLLVFYK